MTEKKPSFGHLIEQSPGEIKRTELELGSNNWMDGLAAELFLDQQLLFRTLSL